MSNWLFLMLLYAFFGWMKKKQRDKAREKIESQEGWDTGDFVEFGEGILESIIGDETEKELIKEISHGFKNKEVEIQKVPCIGRCGNAPAARFDMVPIDRLNISKVQEVLSNEKSFELKLPSYEDLGKYLKRGGYSVFKKVKQKNHLCC